MRTEVCSGCDTTAEEEERVQEVKSDHDDRVEGEILLDGRGNEVEQRQHSEYRYEHVVVDNRRVVVVGRCNHVANQGHDEQSP